MITSLLLIQCASSDKQTFEVSIKGDQSLNNVVIELPLHSLKTTESCAYNVHLNQQNVPSTCYDENNDGQYDGLLVQLDRISSYPTTLEVQEGDNAYLPSKTQAFLLASIEEEFSIGVRNYEFKDFIEIPATATEKSGYAHMEGPVWETNKVGYRIYLDARNRIDIFGKRTDELVLDTVTSDYHNIQDWGADILKVGQSLGLGGFAAYQNGEFQVIDNWSSRTFKKGLQTPLRSSFELEWKGWKVFGRVLDVHLEVVVDADQSYSLHNIKIGGDTEGLKFVTGIVKHKKADVEIEEVPGEGLVVLTNGLQSDQGHSLAMSVMVTNRYKPRYIEDNQSTHLVVIEPYDQELSYTYSAEWNPDQLINYERFKGYNMDLAYKLNQKVFVQEK